MVKPIIKLIYVRAVKVVMDYYFNWTDLDWLKEIMDTETNPAGVPHPSIFSFCSAFVLSVWRLILGGGLWLATWLKFGLVSDFFFSLQWWILSGWKPHWYLGFVRSSPGYRREAAGHPLQCDLIWFDLLIWLYVIFILCLLKKDLSRINVGGPSWNKKILLISFYFEPLIINLL